MDADFANGIPGDVEWNTSAVLEHLLWVYGVTTRAQAGKALLPRAIKKASVELRMIRDANVYTVAQVT